MCSVYECYEVRISVGLLVCSVMCIGVQGGQVPRGGVSGVPGG